MKTTIICLVILTTLGLASCNKHDNNNTAEDQNEAKFDNSKIEKDVDFAMKVAAGGLMEVELGKIAVKNSGSDAVRKFGQDMINDHTTANEELKLIAISKNISLPTVPTHEQQKTINELRAKTGEGFDFDYIDFMVKDHKKDIDLFEKEGEKGDDPEIRSWAASMLSTLKHHLMMAEHIDSIHKEISKIDEKNGN